MALVLLLGSGAERGRRRREAATSLRTLSPVHPPSYWSPPPVTSPWARGTIWSTCATWAPRWRSSADVDHFSVPMLLSFVGGYIADRGNQFLLMFSGAISGVRG
jgi:hypothetical protein